MSINLAPIIQKYIDVSVEISGTFPGSPISLDYHFTIADGRISSLTIDS